jgi:hypothetical protein
MRLFACNVVSKLQSNRCITFGEWRSWTNWPLHVLYISQSQGYFTTDGQSVSMSWCRAQSGTFDQSFFFFFNYSLALFGAPSLTRGRVCHLSVYSQSTVVSQYLHNLYTICTILPSSLNHRLSWSLWIANVLSHCTPIFSPVSDDKYVIPFSIYFRNSTCETYIPLPRCKYEYIGKCTTTNQGLVL